MRKVFELIVFFCLIILTIACNRETKTQKVEDRTSIKYENELFSIELPKGWMIEDSGWKGLDSMQNEVDFFSPSSPVWFHVVKTYLPIHWKNVEEAAQMSITGAAISGEDKELVDRIDSVQVDGYPTTILFFANYVNNDTIIQKQFVTYLQESHIVIYFNENFYYSDWQSTQEYGDRIMNTIRLKKVTNPLD